MKKTGKTAPRTPASGSADDIQTAAKAALGRVAKVKQPKRNPEEQRAEIERVAKEHGADLSELKFNNVLGKMARKRV